MTDMTVEHAMQLADLLYSAGYDARHKERDYDPRGCGAWQEVVEALTAPSVPEGWKLVPMVPTPEMVEMGCDCRISPNGTTAGGVIATWNAMLAASPEEVQEDAERRRQAFVNERASRYRADGMKVEQARIHAETDAVVAAIDRELGKEVSYER